MGKRVEIFEITEGTLMRFESLEESDLERWAVMANGAIVVICDSEEDAQHRRYHMENTTEEIGEGLSFGSRLQCHDGDDEDEADEYEGFVSYDNDHDEDYWKEEEVNRFW